MVDPTAGIGSVADWVAAAGTVAAFGSGVAVWGYDLYRKRKAPANALLAWSSLTEDTRETKARFIVTITVHNSGSVPMMIVTAFAPKDARGNARIPVSGQQSRSGSIERTHKNSNMYPGEEREVKFYYDEKPDHNEFIIAFKDPFNVPYMRRIDTAKYLSRRRRIVLGKIESPWVRGTVA